MFPPLKAGKPVRRIGVCGFGGGTALSAAWRITERYSEDIDGLLFLDDLDLSKNAIEKACGQVAHAVCGACESIHHETHGRNVKVTRIDLDIFTEVFTPAQREKLLAALQSQALGTYDYVVDESLTDFERMLVTRSIEELVAIRGMLTIEAGST